MTTSTPEVGYSMVPYRPISGVTIKNLVWVCIVACGCKNSLWYDAEQPLIRIVAENTSSNAMIFS